MRIKDISRYALNGLIVIRRSVNISHKVNVYVGHNYVLMSF